MVRVAESWTITKVGHPPSLWSTPHTTLEPILSILIINLLLLSIRQHIIGLTNLLEPLLCPRRLILVRMIFQSKFSVSFLDFIITGTSGYSKDLVIIFTHSNYVL